MTEAMSDLVKELEVMAANITTMSDAYLTSKLKQAAARIEVLEAALAEAEKRSDRAVAYIKGIAAVAKIQPTAQECGIKPDLILPETWEDLGRFLGYLSETVRSIVKP